MGSNIVKQSVKHHPQVTHGSIPVLGFLQGSPVGEATPETEKTRPATAPVGPSNKNKLSVILPFFLNHDIGILLIEYV